MWSNRRQYVVDDCVLSKMRVSFLPPFITTRCVVPFLFLLPLALRFLCAAFFLLSSYPMTLKLYVAQYKTLCFILHFLFFYFLFFIFLFFSLLLFLLFLLSYYLFYQIARPYASILLLFYFFIIIFLFFYFFFIFIIIIFFYLYGAANDFFSFFGQGTAKTIKAGRVVAAPGFTAYFIRHVA